MRIAVIGAGAWGTALAAAAANQPGAAVTLWSRQAAQTQHLREHRENAAYLPGIALPERLQHGCVGVDAALPDIAQRSDLVVLGTPMSALRDHLQALVHSATPVVWLCKGFEANAHGPGLLGHEIHAQVHAQVQAPHPPATHAAPAEAASSAHGPTLTPMPPPQPCAVLSGPSFAQEVARQQPTALVAASHDAALRELLVRAFHSPSLRVYTSDDLVGVEVGGAVKNVLAIATGLCDGLGLGLNARAALITRGLAEMTRLGLALGARAETFMGLTGLGDLVLTATGDLSRNRRVGLLLAQGHTLADAVASLGHVAEGVYSARTVVQRAQALGVEMPIAEAVVALLDGHTNAATAVQQLMGREPRHEAGDLLRI